MIFNLLYQRCFTLTYGLTRHWCSEIVSIATTEPPCLSVVGIRYKHGKIIITSSATLISSYVIVTVVGQTHSQHSTQAQQKADNETSKIYINSVSLTFALHNVAP